MSTTANEHYTVAALVVIDGHSRGKRYPLRDGANIIGRAPDCDIVLDSPEISRRHAAVTVGEAIELEDLGSARGTRHNDRMLTAKDFLFDSDEMRVGAFTLRLEARGRESRRGLGVAAGIFAVAIAFAAVAFFLPRETAMARAPDGAAGDYGGEGSWENWSNITLPALDEVVTAIMGLRPLHEESSEDDIALFERSRDGLLAADAAWNQYRTGTRLYLDRYSDLRNPSRAIRHFKIALSLAAALPPADRPAFTHRALTRMRELQERILADCGHNVFAVRKHYQLEDRVEAMRALNDIIYLTQWPDCRYYHWASAELKRLQTDSLRR